MTLSTHVAVVAGATRGGGRAVALELCAAGATVYVTGRSAGGRRSPMDRREHDLDGARPDWGAHAIAVGLAG